ncbi:MAG: hypothetical protein ONB23_11505 [candidate division KSB1 bacterium]|nr:hypothetical protein [candidate division KSB1 bacterium]
MPTRHEVEFVYLSVLTRRGLKPLSRWESAFGQPEQAWLEEMGLRWRQVERPLLAGGRKRELVFALAPERLEEYARAFAGRPSVHTPGSVRLEGRLFGYPDCCVEQYIRYGYAPNGLAPEDQRLLFHWACPGCKVTPTLLPHYRACYREALELARGFRGTRQRRRIPLAAPLAACALLLAGSARAQSPASDPHVISLPDSLDADRNGLLDRYEETLTLPRLAVNGEELARQMASIVDALPQTPQTDRPYRLDFPQWGLETCRVCGETVNMGFVQLVNPTLPDSLSVPFLALHALQHGSLDFTGSLHSGRLHLLRLVRILNLPYVTHTLPLGQDLDTDQDGLLDAAEERLGLLPTGADSDSNRVIDGPQFAVNWAAQIRALETPSSPPKDKVYRVDHFMRGIETCQVCGETVNMGYLEVVNPLENFVLEVPYVALHALEHGSFAYLGTLHAGTIEPRGLHCALHADGTFHQAPMVNDTDGDGLTDEEEARVGTNPLVPDTNSDGIPDGRQLAWSLAAALDGLSREPQTSRPYLIDFSQRGLETCEVCGQNVNMGFVRVVNPVLQDSLDLPYVAWHTLRHGAFTAQGSLHSLRVDPLRLAQLLEIPTSVTAPEVGTPRDFAVVEVYPNPVRGQEAWIRVSIPSATHGESLEVQIFDLLARRVRTVLIHGGQPGPKTVRWDGRDDRGRPLPGGLYFCRVRMGSRCGPVAKVVLLP